MVAHRAFHRWKRPAQRAAAIQNIRCPASPLKVLRCGIANVCKMSFYSKLQIGINETDFSSKK